MAVRTAFLQLSNEIPVPTTADATAYIDNDNIVPKYGGQLKGRQEA